VVGCFATGGPPHDQQESLAAVEALAQNGNPAALVLEALGVLWTDPLSLSPLASTLMRLLQPLARLGTTLLVSRVLDHSR
jgi:hypothetical protein